MVEIRITNTETGVNYQLRDDSDNSLAFTAMGGNNGTIIFSINPVTSSVTYNILATNATTNCEVELTDMAIIMVQDCDFGDLQDTDADTTAGNYQTLLANGGPVHYIRNDLKLGDNIDGEIDGNPHGMARGDDDDIAPDDEDGVMFFSSLNIVPGGIIRLPLTVTNGTGSIAHLEGWIDWNGDGKFSGMDEMIVDISDDATFPESITVNVPDVIADNVPLGVRFRLSLEDNMTPYGLATSGEIEDYLIQIDCATGICLPISSTVIRGTKD